MIIIGILGMNIQGAGKLKWKYSDKLLFFYI